MSAMSRPMTTLLLVAAALLMLAGDAAALSPHVRDGWVLGISYGGARGKATFGDGQEGETKDGVAPQIRIGHMLGSHLALGASYAGWMYETGVYPTKIRFGMQSLTLAGTWYPGRADDALGGLSVRAGGGLGWGVINTLEEIPGVPQDDGKTESDSGLGLELNLGYEFRIVRNVSAGIGIGVNYLDIGGDLYDSGLFYPVTLNLGWYWD
jgi:opacity protein-like surface antigen